MGEAEFAEDGTDARLLLDLLGQEPGQQRQALVVARRLSRGVQLAIEWLTRRSCMSAASNTAITLS